MKAYSVISSLPYVHGNSALPAQKEKLRQLIVVSTQETLWVRELMRIGQPIP